MLIWNMDRLSHKYTKRLSIKQRINTKKTEKTIY